MASIPTLKTLSSIDKFIINGAVAALNAPDAVRQDKDKMVRLHWLGDLVEQGLTNIDYIRNCSPVADSVGVDNAKLDATAFAASRAEAVALDAINKASVVAQSVSAVEQQINDLSSLVETLTVNENARIVGYGASTKGNTILQAANLDNSKILAIEEINPRKFGHFTPKTHIPISDKEEINSLQPTHKLVLPWHFRESIIVREENFLKNGGSLIFPLPKIEIVSY